MRFRFIAILFMVIINAPSVFADCSETKISYESFLEIAHQSDNLLDFLEKLPAHSMTNSTFIHTSQSMKEVRDSITPSTPGVIRGTADSKLVFRYVCDDSHHKMNEIEVMRYDQDSQSFKFSQITLSHSPEQKKVIENPSTCRTCHLSKNDSYSMMRPIWGSYPIWPGIYGSLNDNIRADSNSVNFAAGYGIKIDSVTDEKNFHNFVEKQHGNTCYPDALTLEKHYLDGRSSEIRGSNELRPNLRLSATFGLLFAQALTQRLTAKPEFLSQEKQFAQIVFNQKIWSKNESLIEFTRTPLNALYAIGMDSEDFNLFQNPVPQLLYAAAVYGADKHTGDLGFSALLRTQIAEYFIKNYPELNARTITSRGTGVLYPLTDNSCVDDLGGQITIQNADEVLSRINTIQFGKNRIGSESLQNRENFAPKFQDEIKKSNGYAVLQRECRTCHEVKALGSGPLFMKDEDRFVSRLKDDVSFRSLIRERLDSLEFPMPPLKNIGDDKSVLINFLETL